MASLALSNLAAGESVDEILGLYPTLRREDVTAVMAYAADLLRERVIEPRCLRRQSMPRTRRSSMRWWRPYSKPS